MTSEIINKLRLERTQIVWRALLSFKEKLADIDPSVDLYLFGSYARGDFDLSQSDVDVWIRTDKVFECLEYGLVHLDDILDSFGFHKGFDMVVKDFVPKHDRFYDFLEVLP